MDEKDTWVFLVFGIQPGGTGAGTSETSASPAGEDAQLTPEVVVAQLRERLSEMEIEAKLLADREARERVLSLIASANAAVGKGDLVAAEVAVDAVETAVAEAKRAARLADAQKNKGRISYRKAQIEWRQVRGAAMAGARTLTSQLLNDPRLVNLPDYDDLAAIVRSFPDILPRFDEELEEQLEAVDSETDAARRKTLIEAARGVIADYRDALDDPALIKLQELSDDECGGIDVLHTLSTTLSKIEGSLSV